MKLSFTKAQYIAAGLAALVAGLGVLFPEYQHQFQLVATAIFMKEVPQSKP
jgi:hypothetical protein